MGRLFGTDGIRGIANKELTCCLAFKTGQALACVLKKSKQKPEIVVGRDTRISGHMIENSLIAGMCSMGANAVRLGVISTPAVAYITRLYKADAGVVISASHNPVEYNGIKFFNGKGFKPDDEFETEIENMVLNNKITENDYSEGKNVGMVTDSLKAYHDYLNYVKSTIDYNLSGIKVAVDCANGATFKMAEEVLKDLGAELVIINNHPNGININENCGSTDMAHLQNVVKKEKCDIGVAFDGDGDRMLSVDEKGNIIDGDVIMAIFALNMKTKGILKNNTLVTTVMSNLGLEIAMKNHGIKLKQTSVGDRFVLEQMLRSGENLGGEQSGHIIFLDYNTTGDGLISALQLLSVLKKSGKKLSELGLIMKALPQVMVNAKVLNENKNKLFTDEEINNKVNQITEKYKNKGRVLIRPSGTEPVVRVMIEGEDVAQITIDAKILAELIENKLYEKEDVN